MALWTRLLPLLALLALWAPAPAQDIYYDHLCNDEDLEIMLIIICEDRGYKNPKAPQELPDTQEGEGVMDAGGPKALTLEELLQNTDIRDTCCTDYCSFNQLESYCK